MLTNKQSLLLCVFVTLGFCVSGMLDILDSYVVISILIFAFLAIIINIFLHQNNALKKDENTEK